MKISKRNLVIIKGNKTDRITLQGNQVYNIGHHLNAWTLLIFYLYFLFGSPIRGDLFRDFIVLPASFGLISSTVYFLHAIPHIGCHMTIINKLFVQLAYYDVLLLIMLIPFINIFSTYVNTNSKVGCIEDFRDIWYTAYTVIRIMLNMVDLTTYDVINPGYILVVHIFFVFTISILMVNFLIAIMTNTAGKLMEYQYVIDQINGIWMAAHAEANFGYVLQWYYRKQRNKYLVHEENRYFIIDVQFGKSSTEEE
jgi:hypothetical protein